MVAGEEISQDGNGWKLVLSTRVLGNLWIDGNGLGYYPARVLFNSVFGTPETSANLAWDEEGQCLAWKGKPIPAPVVRRDEGTAWIQIRPLAKWLGLTVVPDAAKKTVTLARAT
jgi:hypothetical protein